MTQLDVYLPEIEALLKQAQLSTKVLQLENCTHGGNNRTFRIKTDDGLFAVKKYFRGIADKRDRLASEFAFLQYAKTAAPGFVPIPYAQDIENGFALYEFIEGNTLTATDVAENELKQAIEFFSLLNDPKKKINADHLPLASEPCFSIHAHLALVGARVEELQQAVAEDKQHQEAKTLIDTLAEHWRMLLDECKKTAMANNINMTAELDYAERCVSPSDFGFHNALRVADRRVRFLDFEYAGWDDPARMANDFFSQLAVPIPMDYYDWFLQQVMQPFPQAEMLMQRARLLRSIYHIKWCCIVLNVFIPAHMERRRFANPQLDVVGLRQTQLMKARSLLKNLEDVNYALY